MTTTCAQPTSKSSQQQQRRIKRLAVVAVLALLLTGCGTDSIDLNSNRGGWWFAIHRNRTSLVFWAHIKLCNSDYECTLRSLKAQASGSDENTQRIASFLGYDFFFDDDVADFRDAMDSTNRPPDPADINHAELYGCLGGYRAWPDLTNMFHPDGDWHADNNGSLCQLGG